MSVYLSRCLSVSPSLSLTHSLSLSLLLSLSLSLSLALSLSRTSAVGSCSGRVHRLRQGLLQQRHLQAAGQPERPEGLVGRQAPREGLHAGGLEAEAVHGIEQPLEDPVAARTSQVRPYDKHARRRLRVRNDSSIQ
jgi:hypothetical protein